MNKADLFFREITICVANQTEIGMDRIMSREKSMEVVDARYLLVYLCYKYGGLYPSVIANKIGYSPRLVSYILTGFDTRARKNKMLGIYLASIEKELGNKLL